LLGPFKVFKKMWPDAWGVRMEHILRITPGWDFK
jgi:hypothetical protein